MLKVILIDDEPESIQVTSALIKMFCPDVQIVDAFTDPFLGLEALKKEKFDTLLLDIEMPGMTGFELLSRLPSIDFDIIFITAYNQYALNAIKLSALDFLLKPVDPSELESALQKAKQKKQDKQTRQQLDVLVHFLSLQEKNIYSQEHKIALPTLESIAYVPMFSIVNIEAKGGYCDFYFTDRRQLLISKNMGIYEEILNNYGFMRIHRSHLINLQHVKEFFREGYVVMLNGNKIEVSGQRKEELLKRLEKI